MKSLTRSDVGVAKVAALVVFALVTSGCYALPRGNGVRWNCEGYVLQYGEPTGIEYPPNEFWVCGNPDLDESRVIDSCEGYLSRRLSTWWYFIVPGGDAQFVGTHAWPDLTTECSRRHQSFSKSAASASTFGEVDEEGLPIVSELQGDPSQYVIEISAGDSPAHVDIDSWSGTTHLSGTVGVNVGTGDQCDADGVCPFEISRIDAIYDNFTMHKCKVCRRYDITHGVVFANGSPLVGRIYPDGRIAFDPYQLYIEVGGSADGDRFSAVTANTDLVMGQFDRSTGAFVLAADTTTEGVSVSFSLQGTGSNFPPTAVMEVGETGECGSVLAADGTASYDTDGRIVSYGWAFHQNGVVTPMSGTVASFTPALGDLDVRLMVFDDDGADGRATQSIAVTDSTAPVISEVPDVTVELCEGLTEVPLAFLEAQDQCEGSLPVTRTLVDFNDLPADELLGDTLLMGQGTALIAYSAVDSSGNVATIYQSILVQRGLTCCPAELDTQEGTGASDVLAADNGGQCVAAGSGSDEVAAGNGGDYILGQSGNDVLAGQNADDQLFGGADDDVLTGNNGDDVLDGGAGDDYLDGGRGDDRIEGGAGIDQVFGGAGNDVIVISAPCHALAGEVMDGGSGADTLVTPLSLAELLALGVQLNSIEQISIVASAEGACR